MKKLINLSGIILLVTLGLAFSANSAMAIGEENAIENVLLDNEK